MMRAVAAGLVLLGALPSAAAKLPSVQSSVVCYFGDSITEGWMDAVRHPERAFPALCDSMLRADAFDARSIPLGAAGETTADALLRVDREVLAVHPAFVVIAFGSNDYYIHGYATESRVSLAEFRKNLDVLGRKILGIGALPIYLGLMPMIESRFSAVSPARLYARFGGAAALQRAYDDAIAAAAARTGSPFVSLRDCAAPDGGSPVGIDGVHPTTDGHRLIAARIAAVIEREFGRYPAPVSVPPDPPSVYPSPFSPATDALCVIDVPCDQPGEIAMTIFNAYGERVAAAAYHAVVPGRHFLWWNGRNTDGHPVAGGRYFIRIQTRERSTILSIAVL